MNYNWRKLLLLFFSISLLGIQSLYAQSPNCAQCDDLIDDPPLYAECVEENCNDAIPIDQYLWVLMLAGTGAAAYALYKH